MQSSGDDSWLSAVVPFTKNNFLGRNHQSSVPGNSNPELSSAIQLDVFLTGILDMFIFRAKELHQKYERSYVELI